MGRIIAVALVLAPLALARAGGDRAPSGEPATSAAAPKKGGANAQKAAPEAAKPVEARKDAPPKQAEAKKAEPPPCEEVKPCPID